MTLRISSISEQILLCQEPLVDGQWNCSDSLVSENLKMNTNIYFWNM